MATTTRECILPFILLGVGVALALAPCTESVMGSLPRADAGVGSATNDTAMQVGGALGVGVLGTALDLRYQHLIAPAVAHSGVPAAVQRLIESSVGAALAVAQRAPEKQGETLALLARQAFVSGMDLALLVATAVVGLAGVLVLALLPNQGSRRLEGPRLDRPRRADAGANRRRSHRCTPLMGSANSKCRLRSPQAGAEVSCSASGWSPRRLS